MISSELVRQPAVAPVGRYETERAAEERRSPRRRTLAGVRVLEGPDIGSGGNGGSGGSGLAVTDLSADGAFIRGARGVPQEARLRLAIEIPTDPQPLLLAARVVRVTPTGVGVRFEEASARDRARLRSHAGFYEMDEAIVRVQRVLGDLIPGNLLPLGEPSEIENILQGAVDRSLPVTVIRPGRGFRPLRARLAALEARNGHGATLRLDAAVPASRVLYLAFSDPPLHYAFEAIVLDVGERGERPSLLVPERVYLTERRAERRSSLRQAWCELPAPYAPEGRLRLPVLDVGEGGASVRIEAAAALVPGTRLPAFILETHGERRPVGGATVRYVTALDEGGGLRAGLRFDDGELGRDTFKDIKLHTARGGIVTRVSRAASLLGGKVAGLVRRNHRQVQGGIEVVRYRNRHGETVAGIVDANFDTSDPTVRPDVAVVIAPAILKRKEVFGLLARTLIDDLDRDGRKVVTLRFDASHIVGESAMDARLVAEGRPYYHWTFGHLAADMEASLQYLERRFRPQRRTLVSLSLSAIPARKVVLNVRDAPVDLWISPYGCPDAQDVLRNYLAGLDLFDVYREGKGPETILIHGRPIRGDSLYGQAMAGGMAFLDEARQDMSRIGIPVTWIVGTYDCWVTRSRVRALLDAPGGGEREVFECATGHVLKDGGEAIELFKLVSESVSKHLFNADRPAREPNLARFARQSEAEWARVQRLELGDAEGFWKEHLFGAPGDDVGYDVLLEHPEYAHFLARQAELLDARPGEHVADFGCGTGNLLLALLDTFSEGTAPGSLTFLDLVPEAVDRTAVKVEDWLAGRDLDVLPPCRGLVADLEGSRLAAVADFLEGRLHGIEGLVGRVEGFALATAHKLAERYGKELHAILRGHPAEPARVAELCPGLGAAEVETVLELGRAARFLTGRVVPADLRPGIEVPGTAADLRFRHLRFGEARRDVRLELPEACFDRIGSSLVLPYLYDPLASLREMYRLLKPGGTLVVSSIRPNFDPSKLYTEGVEILASQGQGAERKLEALRHFANMVSRLIELEEDGRFRFFDEAELKALVAEAGFSRAHAFQAFGSPPVAVIVRAEK